MHHSEKTLVAVLSWKTYLCKGTVAFMFVMNAIISLIYMYVWVGLAGRVMN